VICRDRATDRPEHEITGQQKEKITEGQQESWPLTPLDVEQIQYKLPLHDRNGLAGTPRDIFVNLKARSLVRFGATIPDLHR